MVYFQLVPKLPVKLMGPGNVEKIHTISEIQIFFSPGKESVLV